MKRHRIESLSADQLPPKGSRVIILTRGWVTWVDREDFDYLNRFNWQVTLSPRGYGSARRRNGKIGAKMHREILGVSLGIAIDHIRRYDHIKVVDNRRRNLRVCDDSQNAQNRNKISGVTSVFKGVSLRPESGKWRVMVKHAGKIVHLGSYTLEVHAAYVYDINAVKIFGDRAKTNFPVPGSTNWIFGDE